jgi:serine/threonine protein kinase
VIGRTISHYRIVGQLGVGGMGVVYRAEDDRLGRSVALKFLPEELASDRQAVDRLRAEARAASALNHASICAIYDIGDDEGRPYIVMELLKGQNLRDRLASGGLKIHQLVDVGIQIADALDAAHSEGIIHRDIKPANIFLTDRNQVKLLDFGVAKLTPDFAHSGTTATPDLTMEGVTLGTISYMSPEQATGEPLDGRTDLFSLGVVLYECATGRQPFLGKTSAVILSNILNRAPVAPIALNPELPLHLQEIINNCLEKDRELRYQSAAGLRADLKRLRRDLESGQSRAVDIVPGADAPRYTKGSSGSRAPAVPIDRTQPPYAAPLPQAEPSSRKWRPIAAVVAVVVIAGVGYASWQRTRVSSPAPTTAPTLTDADVQSRIDQAAASLAAKIAEEARQKEQAAASTVAPPAPKPEPSRPAPPVRSEPARAEPPRMATPSTAPTTVPPTAASPPVVPAPAPTSAPPPPVQAAPPPAEPPPQRPPQPQPSTVAPTPPQQSAPAPAAPAAAPAAVPRRDATPAAEEDEAAIRRVVAAYARAIEARSIDMFRAVKPNLSREEQRRLEDSFRAVAKQTVNATVVSIDRRGQEATVVLRRRDTFQAGTRQQTAESQQTLTMARGGGGGWVITEIR